MSRPPSTRSQRAQRTLDRGDVRSAWALAQVPLNIASRGLLPGTQATWLEPRRRELEDVRLQALEVIGRAGLAMGGTQLASAERAARSLIEAEPYRESGYALLMEALALQGNVAEGLRVFDRLRTLLRDELGTMPSAETIAVHERLRPARAPAGRGDRPAAASSAGRTRSQLPAELAAARRGATGRARARALGAGAAVGDGPRRPEAATGRDGSWCSPATPGSARPGWPPSSPTARTSRARCVLAGRAPEETLVPYQLFLEALRPLPAQRARRRAAAPPPASTAPSSPA